MRDRELSASRAAAWLTVERAAYAGIAALAVGLRVYGLSWWPLTPAEAVQSLPAWAAAAGRAYELTGISPLLFTLQRLLFTTAGAGDAAARFWPALLGGLAVLLFYPLRNRLTQGGALMAALLWAISPVAVFTSRLALGNALVPPLALALLAAVNLASTPEHEIRSKAQVAAAVALGLLLAAGPGAYTAILAGLLAAWVSKIPWSAVWDAIKEGRKGIALGLVLSLGLSASFFLTAPAGLAAAFDLLSTWLRSVRPGNGEYGAWDMIRRLLLSEPLLLGFAIAGLVAALRSSVRRRDRFGAFAGVTAGVALVVPVIANGRHPADLGLVVLVLALLAGPAVAWTLAAAWSWRTELDAWLLFGLSLVLIASAAISIPSYFAATLPQNASTYGAVTVVVLILMVVLWLIYGVWGSGTSPSGGGTSPSQSPVTWGGGWSTVARALPAVMLVAGLLWGVGQLTSLSYDRDPGRQAAALLDTPHPGWTDLMTEVRQASALKAGGATEAKVDLVLPQRDPLVPMLRWGLRDFVALRVAAGVPSDVAPIVITPAEPQSALNERFAGAEFTVLQRWRPESLKDSDSRLRWIFYREAKTPSDDRKIVLWVSSRP